MGKFLQSITLSTNLATIVAGYGIIIVRCYGNILCSDCGIQGTNLVRYGNSI